MADLRESNHREDKGVLRHLSNPVAVRSHFRLLVIVSVACLVPYELISDYLVTHASYNTFDESAVQDMAIQGEPESTTFADAPVLQQDRELPDIMDDIVRLLLPSQRAENYIRQHPSRNFSFFVYDDIPSEFTWQENSKCLATKLNIPNWLNRNGTQISNCDWGSSICTEVNASDSSYSPRRFNRNGDVVIAKALLEYSGSLRTYDATKADVFVVPYPSSAHCACVSGKTARCKLKNKHLQDNLFANLAYLNNTSRKRHVFLTSGQSDVSQRLIQDQPLVVELEPRKDDCPFQSNCGRIATPYVNTNPDYQPDQVYRRLSRPTNRTYALAAVMSTKIHKTTKKNVRAEFMNVSQSIMTSYTNQTSDRYRRGIAGMPIMVSGIQGARTLSNERDILDLYQDSIFCPCFRGDTPAQKRIFDALLSGCIPVTIEYEESYDKRKYPSHFEGPNEFESFDLRKHPSHFEPGGASIRTVYPFSSGSFKGNHDMGIDYSKIMVTIDGACGIPCLVPTLEDLLLNHMDQVREMQEYIGRVARLFSFGMEHNSMKHIDAIAAILVRIHHYVIWDK
jgi:hypothetical protein